MVSDRVSIWFSHVLVSHFSGLCSVSNHLFAYFSLVLILHRMKHSWRTDRDPSSQFCQLVMPYMFLLMVNTQVYIYIYIITYIIFVNRTLCCPGLSFMCCPGSWQERCTGDWIIQNLHTVRMWSWDLASIRSLFLVPQWVFRWVSSVCCSF